ncbi:hypothetical protein Desdi_1346 [Desulfitobacterium dichloroeliminans LMG P-21439]|uniref:Cell wall-associated hydrolase, invasion-associated protein n=2 Tax=Desulfitobacteriaceae TaxID=2937909 RepID=L0F867_DESDL|nr:MULTISPECIES: hypothetical protein [Desulfitobacteriaceae]AGA68856.1 hypothetical protein Desdi_1346 [Desulfitobacterium dichloroeliminans LMG P-21439]QHA01088.1 hypothetical protein GQ588_10815 [Dehalobacter restrictus]
MADPATITLAVKAAIAAATDKRTWKAVGILIATILTPFILVIVIILSLLSGTSEHNNAAIDLCFNGGVAGSSVPAEYTAYIEDMSGCFSVLDQAIADTEVGMNGGALDNVRIKSIFYSLYFGAENLSLSDAEARAFMDCFVTYEKDSENHTVAVPVSLDTAYANLSASGIPVTKESRANALQIYQRIVYGGAGSYTGEIEYGGKGGTALDGLTLLHPETKNNLDLVTYAENAFNAGWGYVWGTYGDVLTESLFEYKLEQYPDGVGNYEDFIRENWLGGRTTDCVGLIKGYGWYNPDTKTIEYGTNGMPDVGADGMYNAATVKGSMDTMPDTPGLAVWKSGHIGVYIGNGEVIEAMGTKYGVVKTKLEGRGWKAWLEVPYISYETK